MSDQSEPEVEFDADELKLLKRRASMMGIKYSNNIGVAALREKIHSKMEGKSPSEVDSQHEDSGQENEQENGNGEDAQPNPLEGVQDSINFSGSPRSSSSTRKSNHLTASQRKSALRRALHDKQMRLVRLRIQNLDPKKKDLHGEIFTVANEILGVVSKFVPYGEVTDEGYHVPYCIFRMLEDRRFVNITVTRDRRTGKETVRTNMAKEFALEVLPQLTERELSQLAAAQIAAGSVVTE